MALCGLLFLFSGFVAHAATYTATSVAQLRSYLSSAAPGDLIQLAEGSYDVSDGGIITSGAGAASGYITVRGLGNGATLRWTAFANRACINIRHSYYKLENLTIDANGNSDRGILIEDADHGKLVNCVVKNCDNEAYKIRKNSQYWLLDRCVAQDTGVAGEFGEGFYCGDATANWSTTPLPDETGFITFHRCVALRTMADGFDCKEGTHHIKVVNCLADFQGRNIDTVYGNHGVSTRANDMQVINFVARNNTNASATGEGVWSGTKVGVDGVEYGRALEMKAVTVANWRRYLYWTGYTNATLYTDYVATNLAGIKNPGSPQTAGAGNPTNFVELTWAGVGGGIYFSNWFDVAIGNVTPDGEARNTNGAMALTGGGADIWGTNDQCHFTYQLITNSQCQIITRVTDLTAASGWAKVGVMLRESLAAGAMNAATLITPSNGVRFQRRIATNGTTTDNKVNGVTVPVHLKLVRSGNVFSSWYGTDGTNWTRIGAPQEIVMATNMFAGFCLSSASAGALAAATLEQFSVGSLAAPQLLMPRITNGQFQVQVTGDAGMTLLLQTSTNLVDWTTVLTTNAPALPLVWSEPLTPATRAKFVRAKLGP